MLKPWKITPGHEDLFIQRYDQILSWSMKLTGHNRQLAEDLVHDAFIQFALVRPDLDAIINLEGYLYRMLRNMHLSHLRRASRSPAGPVSPVDYDSAEIMLRASDIHSSVSARQELEIICHYACVRKETSRAGSALILRFFHGYFPGEIALILQSSRQAVAELLRVARQEARMCVDQPRRLSFMREARSDLLPELPFKRAQSDFLNDLRSAIFRSRHNDCIPDEQLQKFYRAEPPEPINAPTLGHIVSCARCLDAVNKLLGFTPLNDRYPTDTLGPDTRSTGGGTGTGDRHSPPSLNAYRRRVREVIEHCPKELRISVNGFILGSQKVSSDLSELSLSLKDAERIDFVEVFSEQGIRLIFCNVDAPPEGQFEQHASISLSEGRNLEVSLSFCGPWPNLNVVYHDPHLKPGWQAQPHTVKEAEAIEPGGEKQTGPVTEKLRRALDAMLAGLATVSSLARPATVTLVLSALLIASVLLLRTRVTTVSATELLGRASANEAASAGPPETVLHRTINLEERRAGDSALIARRRIEVWLDAAKGMRARRVYDEAGRLLAGELTNADGSHTIYARGTRPVPSAPIESQATIFEEIARAWRLDPSAKLFSTLVGDVSAATVRERAASYIIEYRGEKIYGGVRLLRASLTINRSDLRATEQAIVIGDARGEREYRFRESGFERLPASRIAPAVFTPDKELAETDTGRGALRIEKEVPVTADPAAPSPAVTAGPVAMAALEVEALYHLHRVGACLREQASITRTPEGELKIQTVVASDRRKAEILEALGSLAGSPAVRFQIDTIAEALKKESKLPPSPALARRVQITGDRIPLYRDLRQYFYDHLAGDKAGDGPQPSDARYDQEIRRLANRLLNNSRQALLHAWALRHLAGQSSPEELQSLGGEARAKWRAMVRDHAAAFSRETAALRLELRPIFFAGMHSGSGQPSGEDLGLRQAIERLFRLGSAHEEAVRMSFTISDAQQNEPYIKTERFWNSLLEAELLAARIQTGGEK